MGHWLRQQAETNKGDVIATSKGEEGHMSVNNNTDEVQSVIRKSYTFLKSAVIYIKLLFIYRHHIGNLKNITRKNAVKVCNSIVQFGIRY